MHGPSDDEIGHELARFTELSEVMPGGITVLDDAGTLARIVNALPPDTDVKHSNAVRRGRPRHTGVARRWVGTRSDPDQPPGRRGRRVRRGEGARHVLAVVDDLMRNRQMGMALTFQARVAAAEEPTTMRPRPP